MLQNTQHSTGGGGKEIEGEALYLQNCKMRIIKKHKILTNRKNPQTKLKQPPLSRASEHSRQNRRQGAAAALVPTLAVCPLGGTGVSGRQTAGSAALQGPTGSSGKQTGGDQESTENIQEKKVN